jgi:hypothetical protein
MRVSFIEINFIKTTNVMNVLPIFSEEVPGPIDVPSVAAELSVGVARDERLWRHPMVGFTFSVNRHSAIKSS